MSALEMLESVLCDHEGRCCITGTDSDRAIVDGALESLRAELEAAKAEIEKWSAQYDRDTDALAKELEAAKETIDANEDQFWALSNEVIDLKQQLEAAKAEIEMLNQVEYNLCELHNVALAECAARDLVIRELRDHLGLAIVGLDEHWEERNEYRVLRMREAALSLQPNTEALDAYVADAIRARSNAKG